MKITEVEIRSLICGVYGTAFAGELEAGSPPKITYGLSNRIANWLFNHMGVRVTTGYVYDTLKEVVENV